MKQISARVLCLMLLLASLPLAHAQADGSAPRLLAAKKCKKGAKKKCKPDPVALGKTYFKKSCAFSGCHGGEGTSRFVGLDSAGLDAAITNVDQMQFLTVEGKNRTNLLKYLATLK
jgi:hypothetical protein